MSGILETLKFLGSSWLEVAVAVDKRLETQAARIAELEATVATIQAERNQLIGVLQLAVEQSGETGENEPAWLGPACRIMNAGFTKIAALEGEEKDG